MTLVLEDLEEDQIPNTVDIENPKESNKDEYPGANGDESNGDMTLLPSKPTPPETSSPQPMNEELNIGMMNYVKHIFDEQGTQLKELNESINTCFDRHNKFLQKQDNELQEAIDNLNKHSSGLSKTFKESFIKKLRQDIVEELNSFLQSELESSIKAAHQSMKETMEVGHKNYQLLIKLMDQNYKTLFNQYKHPFKTVRLFFWFYIINLFNNQFITSNISYCETFKLDTIKAYE